MMQDCLFRRVEMLKIHLGRVLGIPDFLLPTMIDELRGQLATWLLLRTNEADLDLNF